MRELYFWPILVTRRDEYRRARQASMPAGLVSLEAITVGGISKVLLCRMRLYEWVSFLAKVMGTIRGKLSNKSLNEVRNNYLLYGGDFKGFSPYCRLGTHNLQGRSLHQLYRLLLSIFFTSLILASPCWGQMKVRVNWSTVTGWMGGIWLAYEEGIFKKNELEVELLHIPGASRAISALIAGEISFSSMDFQTAMHAYLNGADVVAVVGGGNRLPISLLARPEIKKVSDLKGKKIGIARIGSLTHTAMVYIVNKAGLTPRDYQMLALVNHPNILNALIAGQIEAGVLASPGSIRARKAGFNELVNLLKDGPEYPAFGIGTTSRYIRANEVITRRVVRSYVEAVHLFKNNKQAAMRVLQKYTKLNDADMLEETYKEVSEYLEGVPYVNRDGLALILANMGEFPAKETQPNLEKFVDMRFVSELEKEGLFKKFFGHR